MTVDITPENVARIAEWLRVLDEWIETDDAADMLEALVAGVAELEADLAAEREALARSKRLRDQYREALDAERSHSNPARAALEGEKP